jgi:hypothetical protein
MDLDISFLSGLPPLLPDLCLFLLHQTLKNNIMAMTSKTTGTVIAAISPWLKILEVDVPVGAGLLTDFVGVGTAVAFVEVVKVVKEILLGEDTTFIVMT